MLRAFRDQCDFRQSDMTDQTATALHSGLNARGRAVGEKSSNLLTAALCAISPSG